MSGLLPFRPSRSPRLVPALDRLLGRGVGVTGRLAAPVALLALLVGLVVAVPAASSAARTVGAPSCVAEAADVGSAARTARECGLSRVEVLSERTERTRVFVDASGVATLESAVVAQRVRRADGSWVAVSTVLGRRADGSYGPAATLADVSFSGGGTGPLVTWREGGSMFTLSWPYGPLPAPRVLGAAAVYESVLPSVNLHVTATVDGFSYSLEVLTAAAAAHPAVRSTRYATGGDLSVVVDGAGGLRLADLAGQTVATVGPASMWDSSTDPALAGEVLEGVGAAESAPLATASDPGPASRRAPVEVGLVEGGLTVSADAAMLADQDVVWPVFIDPPFNKLRSKWAYANETNSTGAGNGKAWVGENPPDDVLYRSFFEFDISTLNGVQILSAEVTMVLDHSYSCASTWLHLYRTSHITVSSGGRMSWTTRPLPSSNHLDGWSGHANEAGGCGVIQPDAVAVFEGSNVTDDLQSRATAAADTYTVGLCACNSDGDFESTDNRWKYFHTNQTYLVATYDLPPDAPTAQALSATTDCHLACVSPAVVRTARPVLKVGVSDPFDGNLDTVFEVRAAPSGTAALVTGNAAAPTQTAAPGTASWQVPVGKLVDAGTYFWRARSMDENDLTGAWSAWQTISVDTSPPAVASVSSSQYPFKQWGERVGTLGTFALSGGADAAEFTWWVDAGSAATVTATGADPKTAEVNHTPNLDMAHTLHAEAKDVAGNVGDPYEHQFWVAPSADKFAHWALDETSGTTAADSGSGGGALSPGALAGGAAFAAGHVNNGVSLDGSGQVTAAGPVLDTTKSFTVMAWARAADLAANDYQTVLSQDGASGSRLRLQYRADANGGAGGWCFTMYASDGGAATSACADGSVWGAPADDTWVHLAGVHDTALGQARVYVMGDPLFCSGETAQAAFSGSWSATGSFAIGRALSAGAAADHWRGDIDEVYAFQEVLTDVEICQKALE